MPGLPPPEERPLFFRRLFGAGFLNPSIEGGLLLLCESLAISYSNACTLSRRTAFPAFSLTISALNCSSSRENSESNLAAASGSV
jgi:hypothetical protein